jgi:hypothetical protein
MSKDVLSLNIFSSKVKLSCVTVRFAKTRFNAIGSPLQSLMAFVTTRVTLRHAHAQGELNNNSVRPGRDVHNTKLVEASR